MTRTQRVIRYGVSVCRPWDSLDAPVNVKRERRGNGSVFAGHHAMSGDSREEIEMCLNCKFPRCTDCLSRMGRR